MGDRFLSEKLKLKYVFNKNILLTKALKKKI